MRAASIEPHSTLAAASNQGRLLIEGSFYYNIAKKLREIEPKLHIFNSRKWQKLVFLAKCGYYMRTASI